MWIQVFVHSGVALGQAASPHAGELSVGEQRGGFKRLTAHAAHPGHLFPEGWLAQGVVGEKCKNTIWPDKKKLDFFDAEFQP